MKFPTSKNAGSEYFLIELDDGKILTESPIFDGKKPWFPVDFPLNQSIEQCGLIFRSDVSPKLYIHQHRQDGESTGALARYLPASAPPKGSSRGCFNMFKWENHPLL